MKQRFLKITAIFMLTMFQLVSWAQVESGLHLGKLELVSSPHVELAKRTITERLSSTKIRIPRDFIGKVGGVAFVQEAKLDINISSFHLGCDYDKNAAYVEINGVTYPIPLPVWQLQPIVNYADDDGYNAAFSMFGSEMKKYPFVYHSAFIDNLLGLRLMQSDMLFFQLDAARELPADKNGYVMAKSEIEKFPDFKKGCQDREKVWQSLQNYLLLISYNTYILTDFDQTITFSFNNGSIQISGCPYYRLYSKKNEKYFFEKSATQFFRQQWEKVYALNPVVMDAVLNTCQWTAFFRYAKTHYSENWTSFVQQIKSLHNDAPVVCTPVAYYNIDYVRESLNWEIDDVDTINKLYLEVLDLLFEE